ncbi:MAG TPA: hypothetical protein VHC46_06040, partial [Thermodesulfobacteriota bacterium]|nr:hypothetical protein [Thermodesulfobacteriota bacterium]
MIKSAQKILEKRNEITLSVILAVVISACFPHILHGSAYAQDTNPKIDPKAASILQEMSYYLGSKYEYTYKAEMMFDDVLESKQKIQ